MIAALRRYFVPGREVNVRVEAGWRQMIFFIMLLTTGRCLKSHKHMYILEDEFAWTSAELR